MFKKIIIGSVIVSLILISVSVESSMDKMIEIYPKDEEQYKFLAEEGVKHGVYFLDIPDNSFQLVIGLVDMKIGKEFLNDLDENNIEYKLEDTERLVTMIDNQFIQTPLLRGQTIPYDYNKYNTLNSIYKELDNLMTKQTNKVWNTEILSIGKSYKNTPIKAMKISQKRTNNLQRTVLIECGSHAREWSSPAICMWIIRHILEDSESNKLYDYIIIPVLNPDGYNYTWSSATQPDEGEKIRRRLHRKNNEFVPNTEKQYQELGPFCGGTDLNRNFQTSSWCSNISTQNRFHKRHPCGANYCGKEPFSAPETRALRDFLTPIKSSIVAYFSIHAFSGLWLFPKSWSNDWVPEIIELRNISEAAVGAIKSVNGLQFTYGTVPQLMYPAEGSSMDWAYEQLNVKYAFIIEVRPVGPFPVDISMMDFYAALLLNTSEINPMCRETWKGIEAALKKMLDMNLVSSESNTPLGSSLSSKHMPSFVTTIFVLILFKI